MTPHRQGRMAVTFDDDHAVANAGMLLPATLAQHLGVKQLFDWGHTTVQLAIRDLKEGARLVLRLRQRWP